jgi:ATP-dependent DNA ligase
MPDHAARQVAANARRWYAFDLIELDGRELRREPIETRKTELLKLLRKADYAIFLK